MLTASIAIYLVLLLGATEAIRRFPRVTLIGVPILTVAMTPYWLHRADIPLFAWVKIYSVIAGVIWLYLLRTTRLGDRRWARNVGFAILAINILEAVVLDGLNGNVANALAGAIVLAASFKWGGGAVEVVGPTRELYWQTARSWVLAYTIWNIAFVLLNFGAFTGGNIAVLGAALLVGLYRPALWLHARAVTLMVHQLIAFSDARLLTLVDTPGWADLDVARPVGVMSLIITAVACWVAVRRSPPASSSVVPTASA